MLTVPIRTLPLKVFADPAAPINGILGIAYNFSMVNGLLEITPGTNARDSTTGFRTGINAQDMPGMFSHLRDFQHYGFYLEPNGANFNLRPIVHGTLLATAAVVRPQETIRIEAFGAVRPPEIYAGNRLAYAFGLNDGGHAFNAPCPFGFHGQPYQADISFNNQFNNSLTINRIEGFDTVILNDGYTNSVAPSGTIAAASPQAVGVAFAVTCTFLLTAPFPYDHVDLFVDGQLYTSLFLGLDPAGVSGLTSPQLINVTINSRGLHYLVARYYNAALKFRQTPGITVQVN